VTEDERALLRMVRRLALRPADERRSALRGLTLPQKRTLKEFWAAWAHDGQAPPAGNSPTWLMVTGRGFGKTRAGAEWVSGLARADGDLRIALVGATIEDALKVMVTGRSGLTAVARTGEDVKVNKTAGIVTFASGAEAFLYSGACPEKLRGPEHHFAWCDELAKWRYPEETWDNLQLGLRLGAAPRTLVTTTPKSVPLLKRLVAASAVSRGRTADNLNLPDSFVARMEAEYRGTRLGREELDGELIEDVEGALWTRALIEACRIPSPSRGEGRLAEGERGEGSAGEDRSLTLPPGSAGRAPPSPLQGEESAELAERAARLSKADLVTQMVGEFPELQGIIGGHLARAQGEDSRVADAIRDHYKPVGQGDDVPTAPVTVAVSLADKLDTLFSFFWIDERPSGSRDPFALRRAAIGIISLILGNAIRLDLLTMVTRPARPYTAQTLGWAVFDQAGGKPTLEQLLAAYGPLLDLPEHHRDFDRLDHVIQELTAFLIDRLKVQQREAGVRHDLIDAVFALGGEDDLVRLLARVRALQAFVETPEGADLLAGYKRAANILKKEGYAGPAPQPPGSDPASARQAPGTDPAATPQAPGSGPASPAPPAGSAAGAERQENKQLSYTPEKEEDALIAALDSAEPRARAAVAAEEFEGAMAALASLRGPVDAFFDKVTVNDPDETKRQARLALLARMRDAVHQVADFSRIEG
jgi:glycyl-tRNA synthetase beta chain